jgi:hypothetical protein
MNEENCGLAIARFRDETTRQLTSYNPEHKIKHLRIPHGTRLSLPAVTGQGYIAQFWITFSGWFWQWWNGANPISQTILKTLILRIYWDGEANPAVQTPAGDFFGNGLCEISNFTSRYFGMSSGGFFCKFPMPFAKGFRLEFENADPKIDTEIFVNVLYQLGEAPAHTGYFHTQFRTGINQGYDAVPVLEAEGRGHFVGCTFSAQGEQSNYFGFLEAPEQVYLDDAWEKPAFFGTGLEDYFLGGWYFREGPFIGELHGVTSKNTLNSSIAMYRTHEADAIRFRRRIRFEFYNPGKPAGLKPFMYSSAARYYLDTPAGREPAIPAAAELTRWYRIINTDRVSIP